MESILNTTPRQVIPARKTEDGNLRTSIILVIVGLVASALGGMMYGAASGEPQGSGNEPLVLGLGSLLLGAGVLSFIAGILSEFFSMGTSLRSIATSSEATLSLLIKESPGRPAGI